MVTGLVTPLPSETKIGWVGASPPGIPSGVPPTTPSGSPPGCPPGSPPGSPRLSLLSEFSDGRVVSGTCTGVGITAGTDGVVGSGRDARGPGGGGGGAGGRGTD